MSDLDRLADDYNAMRREWDDAEDRARRACQILIAEIGADGPADVDDVAKKAVEEIRRLRKLQEESEHDMHLRIRAGYDKTVADSWRQKLAEVEAERNALREALQWYVEHDDTNEGGKWEESNAGWLEGKRRAQALLGKR